jgi:hypothetical protein
MDKASLSQRERKGFPRAFLDAWFDCARWLIDAQMLFWTGICPASFEKILDAKSAPPVVSRSGAIAK